MLQKLIKNIICILIIAVASTGTIASATDFNSEVEEVETSETIQDENNTQDNEEVEPEPDEILTGWQEIEGKMYYFSLETGEMLTGWQEIDWEMYYFSLETGEMLTGRQKIDEKFYYFDEDGILQIAGWAEDDGITYYCGKKGVLVSGWKKIEGDKYYFSNKNNEMFIGLHKIGKDYYIFNKNGQLAQSDGISIIRADEEIYCAGADGKAASGWQIKRNKLYYATKKGKVRRNTTYKGIVLTKTGAAKDNTNSRLKMQLIKVIRSITNETMSKSRKLSTCWSYIVRGSFRYASKYPNLNSPGWQRSTAYNMLSTHSGNCYSYACAFAALASEIGYKPYIVCGRGHGSRDRTADGYTRHAWVRINGLNYDPEAQYAGWMRGIYARRSYPAAHQIQKVVAY